MSSPRPATVVALTDIDKAYANRTVALRRFSLAVEEGSFVSLLGPSGCGKSTVLRLIAGLASPTAGRVDWPAGPGGRPGHDISFVFQEPTLMPWSSVFGNVYLPLKLRGQSRRTAAEAVMGALRTVGLEAVHSAYPRELSGGMKMRVSIARALVTEPTLLLMDEPFAALDEITRFRLNDDLLELRARFGFTVVFVTHSVFESVYLSDRIVVMAARPGRVAADIAVDAGYPRGEEFRADPAYANHCRVVSAALRAAMAGLAPGPQPTTR